MAWRKVLFGRLGQVSAAHCDFQTHWSYDGFPGEAVLKLPRGWQSCGAMTPLLYINLFEQLRRIAKQKCKRRRAVLSEEFIDRMTDETPLWDS